jgi:chaperone BCS1
LSNNSNDTLLKPLSIECTKLTELAAQFSASLPEETFSPAEVQGFLLMKKSDPEAAVKEVGKWRDAQIEAKMKGKKVVESSSG